jgi:hypothetical protein
VACRPLDWDLSAADALRLVRHDPHPVALLGAWADGSDIVASCPAATIDQPGTPFSTDCNFLQAIRDQKAVHAGPSIRA